MIKWMQIRSYYKLLMAGNSANAAASQIDHPDRARLSSNADKKKQVADYQCLCIRLSAAALALIDMPLTVSSYYRSDMSTTMLCPDIAYHAIRAFL